jgi:hypothetical protein
MGAGEALAFSCSVCMCPVWNAPCVTHLFAATFHPWGMFVLAAAFLASQPLCMHPAWNAPRVARLFAVTFYPCNASVLAVPFNVSQPVWVHPAWNATHVYNRFSSMQYVYFSRTLPILKTTMCARPPWNPPRVPRSFAIIFYPCSTSVSVAPFLASQLLCVCLARNASRVARPFAVAFHPCSMFVLAVLRVPPRAKRRSCFLSTPNWTGSTYTWFGKIIFLGWR